VKECGTEHLENSGRSVDVKRPAWDFFQVEVSLTFVVDLVGSGLALDFQVYIEVSEDLTLCV